MRKYADPIIVAAIGNAKTKDKILVGIEKLEGINFGYDLDFKIVRNIIKHLSVNSTPDDLAVMEQIWKSTSEYKRDLIKESYEKSVFGRKLIVESLEPQKGFNLLMEKGTHVELENFLKSKPEFFQTNTLSVEALNYSPVSYKKLLICVDAGLVPEPKVLLSSLSTLDKKEKLEKVLDFVTQFKNNLSPENWDKAIHLIMHESGNLGYRNKGYRDSYVLIDLLNNPENYAVHRIEGRILYETNTNYFDKNNKNLSKKEMTDNWVEALSKTDLKSLFTTEFTNFFINDPSYDNFILKAIDYSMDKLVVDRYSKAPYPTFENWPISRNQFKPLLKNPVFYEKIVCYVADTYGDSAHKTLLGEIYKHSGMDIYDFYIQREQILPFKDSSSEQHLKNLLLDGYAPEKYRSIKLKMQLDLSTKLNSNLEEKNEVKKMKI